MFGAMRVLLQSAESAAVDDLTQMKRELSIMFLLLSGYLVFFMQCGFALIEAGTVRPKNVKNILFKNVVDAAVSVLTWWAVGEAFAYGACGENGFIGYANFFTYNSDYDTTEGVNVTYWARWFFTWAFSATAATVVSGSVAERMQLRAYAIYTALMSAWIYPIVAHWVWSKSGWLSSKRVVDCATGEYQPYFSDANGLLDFSGSGVVHLTGGCAGLMGTLLLGPRIGRFSKEGHLVEFQSASPANQVLGVFVLWFGWYGFNPGSVGCFSNCMHAASLVAVNTTLAAGAGGCTTLLLSVVSGYSGDIGPLVNGILAGLVSITGPCAFVQPYCAVIIGMIAAPVYVASSRLLIYLKVDDPLDAVPVHLFCGIWGLLASGFFATKTNIDRVFGYENDAGVFFGGDGTQLGIQLLGIVCIMAWSCIMSGLIFGALKLAGWLRVSEEDEEQGLDIAQSIGSGIYVGSWLLGGRGI